MTGVEVKCGNCDGVGWVMPRSWGELDSIDKMVAQTVGLGKIKKVCGDCHGKGTIRYG